MLFPARLTAKSGIFPPPPMFWWKARRAPWPLSDAVIQLPFTPGDRVLDVAVFIARDGHGPVSDEGTDEAHPGFLHHPPRGCVHCHGGGNHPLHAELGKPLGDQRREPSVAYPSPTPRSAAIAQLRLVGDRRGGPEWNQPRKSPVDFSRAQNRSREFPVVAQERRKYSPSISPRGVGAPPVMYRIRADRRRAPRAGLRRGH